MCEFYTRLMAAAERLGAHEVRFEPRGTSANDGRFRKHAHIAGVVAGKPFRFCVPGRPKDTPRRWLNYVTKLRRLLVELGAPSPQVASDKQHGKRRYRKALPRRSNPPSLKSPAAAASSYRLSRDPWGPLHALREQFAAAGPSPSLADVSKE